VRGSRRGGPEEDPIATERSLIDVIQAGRVEERKAEGGKEKAEEERPTEKPETGTAEQPEQGAVENPPGTAGTDQPRSWAILPQVGFTPEKGANGGVKFKDRDVTSLHLTLDLAASAAIKGQYHLDTVLISPSFFTDRLLLLAEGEYYSDPPRNSSASEITTSDRTSCLRTATSASMERLRSVCGCRGALPW
jgi:hypothetical protein